MAINIAALLGQAGALGAIDEELLNADDQYAEDGSTEIRVTGRPRYDPRSDPEPPNFGDPAPRPEITPRYVLNDDRMQPTQEELQEIIPRSGRFGVKGTLRDVLGTLGDAFLLQGGADRIYEPRRQMERESDAMFGFTQNPMDAIERLTAAGNTAEARALYDGLLNRQIQARNLESQDANRQDLQNDRRYTNLSQARNQIARWLQAADTPAKQQVVLDQAKRLAAELGVDIADLGLTGELTEDLRDILAAGDMTVNQQVQVPLRQRQLDIGQQNANANTTRANRPPAARQPRAQSPLEYFQQLSDIPASRRTEEQNAWIRNYTGQNSGRSRIPAAPPPPRGGSNLRIRAVREAK